MDPELTSGQYDLLQTLEEGFMSAGTYCVIALSSVIAWLVAWHSSERWSLAGELSLSCARSAADG